MDKENYHKLLETRKDEEETLYTLIKTTGLTPREVINTYPINHKRAWYILEKWTGKGKYEYGVALDLGWLVESN